MKDEEVMKILTSMSKKVTEMYNMLTLFVPKNLTVSELAKSLGKDTGTIRVHLEGNFLKNIDYFQEVKKGKILIPRATAINIAQYYLEKEKHA